MTPTMFVPSIPVIFILFRTTSELPLLRVWVLLPKVINVNYTCPDQLNRPVAMRIVRPLLIRTVVARERELMSR